MAERNIPPGWDYNPSRWSQRLPVLALSLLGCAIATYLTLYQVDLLPSVWEPFFGEGSRHILKHSAVARLLHPVPDASLGAFVYFLEAVSDCVGGDDRWRTRPWAVLLLGLIALGLCCVGILLAIIQPTLFGAYCTLCLASAACSVLMFGSVADEVLASLQHLKREHVRGRSWWRAFWGVDAAEATGLEESLVHPTGARNG